MEKPRTGSRSEATPAGTGQSKGDLSRRVAPVATKRSSGAARRRRGSPSGANGSGCKSPDGADAQRDPGDCNAANILLESPRTGSRSEATSAGIGQNKGDFSPRVAPVTAKRVSADGLTWFFVAVVIIKRTRPETTRHLFAG